jgi:O-acetyl-ADP-ribose deacetylase (regulator of RNase III)
MKYIKKDLIMAGIEGDIPAIMHQCNCQGVMGSGLAKQIKYKMPEAFEVYTNSTKRLGEYSNVLSNGCMVFNLYGQDRYGRDKRYTNYAALFASIMRVIYKFDYTVYGIPAQIGCGLGGGNWLFVQDMLQDIEKIHDVEFYVYEHQP